MALSRARSEGRARFFGVRESAVIGSDTELSLTSEWSDPATYIASDDDGHYFAVDLTSVDSGDELSSTVASLFGEGSEVCEIQQVVADFDARDAGLATAAIALFAWHTRAKFCETCGGALHARASGWERVCPAGHVVFPRQDPAVIMAIRDEDDRLLLGRNSRWAPGRYSTLAGFVEAGETLEAAVRREVHEEVGVEVGDVEYVGSQPWPFPRSLMLAFRGWARGEQVVRVDGVEIDDAFFISREDFKSRVGEGSLGLPGRASVAYALIEDWLGEELP